MSLPDQSICVVYVIESDGAGFVGIGEDYHVYVRCISEFVGLLEALKGDLRVWDVVGKTWPGP